jgi:hypothetical protein
MATSENSLHGFVFEPGLEMWEGERLVPFWGNAIPIRIAAPATGPSRRQREILAAILNYQGDLHSRIEEAVFAHYKQHVEGTTGYFERGVDVTAQRAPTLQRADEVWGLLSDRAIYIPAFRAEGSELVFELHMDCSWDKDHGLCVLIRAWQVAKVAGQMDCKGGLA